jgi:prevent-host-death family protein
MRRFWRRWSSQTGQTSLTRATPSGQLAQYNTYDARTYLSDLLRRVRTGEEIVIAHAGRPIAKLVPLVEPTATRPGVFRMTVVVNDGMAATEPAAKGERP